MNIKQRNWDTVVIGGGLAGLTAAIHLAQAGKSVLLCEKGEKLGGRASTVEKNGCLFNLGPHALYKNGAGLAILHELGVCPQGGDPDLNGKLIYQEQAFPLPLSPISIIRSKLFTLSEKIELANLYTQLGKIDPSRLEQISLQDWMDTHIQHPKVALFFATLFRLSSYSNDPEQASASIIIRQFQRGMGGVLYLDDGWQSLIQHLQAKAEELGVTILVKQKIDKISGSFPELECTIGMETIYTKAIISTAPPALTEQMVVPERRASLTQLNNELIPVKGASLDIALKKLPHPRTSFALDMNKSLYYSNHSKAAKLTHDSHHSIIHLFKYFSSHYEQDAKETRRELEAFLDLLQPGWQKEVVAEQFLPQMTVSLGLPKVGQSMPRVMVDSFPGLFLAGDWIYNHGLLADASISSGKEAAQQVIHHLTTRG